MLQNRRTLHSISTNLIGMIFILLVYLAIAPNTNAQQPMWGEYELSRTGWATTPDTFLGKTYVGLSNDTEWVYSLGIGSYFYLPEELIVRTGAWAYAPSINEEIFDDYWADWGWLYSHNANTWVYAFPQTLTSGRGWVFIQNGETAVPVPDKYVVNSSYTAGPPDDDINLPGYTNARPADAGDLARFENAFRFGLEEMEEHIELDPDVTMENGPEGLTFTSTAGFGNRFVRIFSHPAAVGLLDLSALDGVTGEIGVTVRGSVDLSADMGGFYTRLKDEGIQDQVKDYPGIPDYIMNYLVELTDAGAHTRLEGGSVYEDVLMETYTNYGTDSAYIELTLPPQASVTVEEIFMHMEPEIRGFADLESRITGGEGATEENTYTVTNVDEMEAALDAVENTEGPSIIYVDGTLDLADWEGADGDPQQFSINQNMRNLSIVGVEDNALLDGIGFKVHGTNIIIENLTMTNGWMISGVEVNDGRYVHVTQCTFFGDPGSGNRFDEFTAIKNQARYVIFSWNYMYDDPEGRGMLIGSNDGVEALPDRSVILHHNWFQNVGSRHPLVRGGFTHIYNNYFDNIDWGANVRTRARVRLENNYFLNAGRAIFPGELPEGLRGKWELYGNIYDGGDTNHQPTESTVELNFESDYTYTLDPAEDVPTIVTENAGAGRGSE